MAEHFIHNPRQIARMGTDQTDPLTPKPKSSSDPCKSVKSVVKTLQNPFNHNGNAEDMAEHFIQNPRQISRMGMDKSRLSETKTPNSSSDPCKSAKSVVKNLQRFLDQGCAQVSPDSLPQSFPLIRVTRKILGQNHSFILTSPP